MSISTVLWGSKGATRYSVMLRAVAVFLLFTAAYFIWDLTVDKVDPEVGAGLSAETNDIRGPASGGREKLADISSATPDSGQDAELAVKPYSFDTDLKEFLAGGHRISGVKAAGIISICQGWDSILDAVYKRRVGLAPSAAADLTRNMEEHARACQFLTPEHVAQLPAIARRAFAQGEKGAAQLVLAYPSDGLTAADLVRLRKEIRDDFLACVPYAWSYFLNPLVQGTDVERAAALFVHQHHKAKWAAKHGEAAPSEGFWKDSMAVETVEAGRRLATEVIARCQD